MATIERYQTSTGATRYMVRYRTPQHTQTKKRGFTTKRAAEAFANTVEVEKLTGNYVAPSLGQVTVRELGKEWLARQAHHKASWSVRLESVWPLCGCVTSILDVAASASSGQHRR